MKTKIFISLNILDKARKNLIAATEKWRDLPIKWTPEKNIHLTLVFLGFINEDDLPEICLKVGNACRKSDIFDIDLEKIELFPSKKEPKLIALTGPANIELKNLVNNIEKELQISNIEKKSFSPHITLGRIRKLKWEALENKPDINENFKLHVAARSVDIMASDFSDGTNKYSIIESCPLK